MMIIVFVNISSSSYCETVVFSINLWYFWCFLHFCEIGSLPSTARHHHITAFWHPSYPSYLYIITSLHFGIRHIHHIYTPICARCFDWATIYNFALMLHIINILKFSRCIHCCATMPLGLFCHSSHVNWIGTPLVLFIICLFCCRRLAEVVHRTTTLAELHYTRTKMKSENVQYSITYVHVMLLFADVSTIQVAETSQWQFIDSEFISGQGQTNEVSSVYIWCSGVWTLMLYTVCIVLYVLTCNWLLRASCTCLFCMCVCKIL